MYQQSNGKQIEGPGIGVFDVEWHLGGDLKTLKCMLGCKHGANTLFPCIFYCHPKLQVEVLGKKGKAPTKGNARKQAMGLGNAVKGKGSNEWFNGILSCDTS